MSGEQILRNYFSDPENDLEELADEDIVEIYPGHYTVGPIEWAVLDDDQLQSEVFEYIVDELTKFDGNLAYAFSTDIAERCISEALTDETYAALVDLVNDYYDENYSRLSEIFEDDKLDIYDLCDMIPMDQWNFEKIADILVDVYSPQLLLGVDGGYQDDHYIIKIN